MSIYTRLTQIEEEEEKKKRELSPSQVAASEQKAGSLYQRLTTREIEEPKIEKEPSFIERGVEKTKEIVGKVADLFKPRKIVSPVPEEEIIKPDKPRVTQEAYKQTEDSYLKFPSIFPHPELDLESKEFGASAQLRPEARDAANKFWSNPVDNSIQAIRDFLDYHPKVLDVLAGAQKIVEETPYVGLKESPLTRGIARQASSVYLGSSNEIKNTFEKRLNHPVTSEDQVVETVGEVIGGVMAYMAGGAVLRGLGLARATLPVLFATLGQTSAPAETTIEQRIKKLPVDVVAGWIFSKVPALKGMRGGELMKAGGKGIGLSATALGGSGFLNALIEGKSEEEAAQIAAHQALIGALFYVSASAIGLLSDEILTSKVKTGKGVFTGDEIRKIVNTSKLKGTKMGTQLLSLANQADGSGKNIEIDMTAMQKSFVSKKLNLNKPEGLGYNATLVDRPPEIGAKPPTEPPPKPPKAPTAPRAPLTEEVAKRAGISTLGKEVSVFRGAKDQTIDVSRTNGITGGVSFSTAKTVAERFAKKEGGTVAQYTISEDARIIDHSKLEAMVEDLPVDQKTAEINRFIVENKIDVVRFDVPEGAKGEEELRIVNDRVLKEVALEPEMLPSLKKAGDYVSATDFAKAEFEARPTDQIGKMDASKITARDTVDEAGVQEYVKRIKAGEEIEPIEITKEEGKFVTVEGSHRITAYQQLGQEAPVVYRGEDKVAGLQTFEEVYKQATGVVKKPKEPAKKPKVTPTTPKELEPLAQEARKYKTVEEFIKAFRTDARGLTERIRKGLTKDEISLQQEAFDKEVLKRMTPDARKLKETQIKIWARRDATIDFLKDFYDRATKEAKKPKAVPAPTQAKPKKIKLKKVKPVKKQIFKTAERKALQKQVGEIVGITKNQEQAVKDINNFIVEQINNVEDPLYTQKLKAVRAELKRQMYEMVGADTGNWKKDYAFFQTLRNNPDLSEIVDRVEDGILEIDEVVNPSTPSSTLGHASSGAISIGEFEQRTQPKQGTREFKLYEQVKALTQKYAKMIGEGYTPRRALGVYYKKTTNIRVNAINNLSTASHEITHFLDDKFKISDKLMAVKGYATNGNPIYDPFTLKYRKEMTDLYTKYYPGGKKTHSLRKRTLEGFATLLQKYVEAPNRIKNEYPLLVRDFWEKGGRYYRPVMGEIIKDLSAIVKDYQGLSALDKIGSRVTSEAINTDKPSFMNFGDKLRTFLADQIYPIEVIAKKAGVQLTKADPSLWLRAYNSISGIVNNNISTDRGYWTLTGDGAKKTLDYNWKTLVDLNIKNKNTDDFSYYLVARREYYSYQELTELKKKFDQEAKNYKEMSISDRKVVDPDGRTPKERLEETKEDYKTLQDILKRDGITQGEAEEAYLENKDRFVEEEKMFDVLTRADLELLASDAVQLITPKQFKELSSQQGYASFKRQFYDDIVGDYNEITGVARVGKTKVSSLIKRKGSERTIINPVYNGITNHSEALRKAAKQIVYNKITDIGTSAAFPDLFQELELKVHIDKETGMFSYPQERDPNIIMGRQNYKRKPVLIDGRLKGTIDNILTHQNIDTFVKLYTGMSRFFTAGTTGFYPQFTATNFLRDQITAQANTTNKYKALYSPLKTFGELIQKKDSEAYKYYQEYMIMGGERQTFTGWQKLPPDKLFKRISQEKSALEKAIKIGEGVTDVLSTPAKYSELITRASEYILSRKNGNPPIVALEEAGRFTAPFHHVGTWGGKYGQTFIRGLPFFNAALQVLDQHARVAGTPKGRKRLAFVLMAITAAYLASIMAMFRASDDQEEQYKDLTGEELANFIHFPHPSGKKLIRVPMSEVFTPLGAIINMIIADKMFGTRFRATDYKDAAVAWIPDQFNITEPVKAFFSWMPQVFKAGAETIIGVKTWPKVTPLETQGLKNLPPSLRATENTSGFAKWLGKKTDLSPIKIDHFITGYFGRAMGLVTGKPSAWQWDSSIIREYWFSYGRRVNGLYDLKEENDTKYNAHMRGRLDINEKEAREIYRVYVLSSKFSDVMSDYREADIEKEQEKAADLRNEAIQIINMIENGDEPTRKQVPKTYSNFNDWVRKANKRRKDKIKELNK